MYIINHNMKRAFFSLFGLIIEYRDRRKLDGLLNWNSIEKLPVYIWKIKKGPPALFLFSIYTPATSQ